MRVVLALYMSRKMSFLVSISLVSLGSLPIILLNSCHILCITQEFV